MTSLRRSGARPRVVPEARIMLKQLRSQRLMKNVLRGTLILVIPSFLLFYGWSELNRTDRADAATFAWVSPPSWLPWPFTRWQPIGVNDLRMAGESLFRKEQLKYQIAGIPFYPQGSPSELFDRSEIVREALYQRIIRDFAVQTGIVVTDDDLRAAILQRFPQPVEQSFRAYLAMRRTTEERYREDLRNEILNQLVMDRFLSRSKVSLFETWQEYTLQNEDLQLDYIRIPASHYVDAVAIDEAGLETFFNERVEEYRVPEQRKYQYIAASRAQVERDIVVSDDDARAYYEAEKETDLFLRSSPQTLIRHILLRFPDPDFPVADAAMNARMQAILSEASEPGADFAGLADTKTEDSANTETVNGQVVRKGGLLGWIGNDERAEWGDRFVDAALALTPESRLSGIVSSPQGQHILYAEDFRKSEPKPFDEVVDVARARARDKRIEEELQRRMDALEEAFEKTTSLAGMANELGVELRETDFLDSDNYLLDPDVGSVARDAEYLGLLHPGERSGVLSTPNGVICLLVMEVRPSRLPDLAESRTRVEQDYRNHRALELAESAAAEAEEQGRTLADMERWAEANGFRVETTPPFRRVNQPPDINENVDDLETLTYKTPIGAVRRSTLSLGGQGAGWIVWRIKDVKSPTNEDFNRDYFAFQREQIFLKQLALYEEWLAESARRWKIKFPRSEA